MKNEKNKNAFLVTLPRKHFETLRGTFILIIAFRLF
jgi:hypothetical protein